MKQNKILIVGGGFGGVRAALDLEKSRLPNTKIILVSDKPHFEYHAALYRVVTGRSPLEVCVPLSEIFAGKNVEVLQDSIIGMDLGARRLEGFSGAHYSYDFLVLALGSETAYFDIPGLRELSFGFKSINEALRLKRHLHELFEAGRAPFNIVVVGGGASGTELAGELAIYTRKLARLHQVDPSLASIDLVEGASRILPLMPEDFSRKVAHRLRDLGVNIFVNRLLVKEEVESVHLRDMEMKTKTVIWTAGVAAHHLLGKKKVAVDKYLQAKGRANVFVIGDAAATKYSGMAQTAIADGRHAARVIAARILRTKAPAYKPQKPGYAIPAGRGWAAVLIGNTRIYGILGWWIRRAIDFRYFLSILPFDKAVLAFRSGKTLCESCLVCTPEGGEA